MANYDIPIGTLAGLKFRILNDAAFTKENSSRSFELDGEVRYSALTREKAHRLGIRFVNITEPERQFIAHYVKTQALSRSSET